MNDNLFLPLLVVSGGLGASCRLIVDDLSSRLAGDPRFPFGTLAVNLSGALVAALVVGLIAKEIPDETLGTIILFGFLGSYTTFSTWMYEAAKEIEEGRTLAAVSYILITVSGGIAATVLGLSLI